MPHALPTTLTDALALRAGSDWRVVAGGTDVYPARVEGRTAPLLDLSALADLARIEQTGDTWRIGALVTWTQLIETPLPRAFDALKLAAREIGSVQIQNVATLAGNLCNASPAADGVPPLLILDAAVELASTSGTRVLPLAQFILGNRRTALRNDEIMTAILVPRDADATPTRFLKLGARRYLVISIAMVAAQLVLDANGRVARARVAVGSCSEVAARLPALEAALAGRTADATLPDAVDDVVLAALAPIDDVRGTAAYRRAAANALVRRALAACLDASA